MRSLLQRKPWGTSLKISRYVREWREFLVSTMLLNRQIARHLHGPLRSPTERRRRTTQGTLARALRLLPMQAYPLFRTGMLARRSRIRSFALLSFVAIDRRDCSAMVVFSKFDAAQSDWEDRIGTRMEITACDVGQPGHATSMTGRSRSITSGAKARYIRSPSAGAIDRS